MQSQRLKPWVTIWFVVALLTGCADDAVVSLSDREVAPPAVAASDSSAQMLSLPPIGTSQDLEIPPVLVDVARSAGIDFTYFNDEIPGRFFFPEVMGGGAGWLDFDSDGWLDLYVTNGCRLADGSPGESHVNRLYRNGHDGTFEDVTVLCGAGDSGFGQGCAVGDFNADGFPDLYVTNYGRNTLLLNRGDGTFGDVTDESGAGDPAWGTGALWLDLDDDALLDLYVVNYAKVSIETHKICEYGGRPGYCGPGSFEAAPDRVFRNSGDGTFEDMTEALGFRVQPGKGLAVIAADLDNDLRPEVYVGNDLQANFLFTRRKQSGADDQPLPRWQELAVAAGCALSGSGENEASMGLACADFDADGRFDLFLTHYFQSKNTLYRNLGNLLFADDSFRSRIAATSFQYLGFGTAALDYDRDGAFDLFVANGHVLGPFQSPALSVNRSC